MVAQALTKFFFRRGAFPGPAETEGIHQCEQVVERRIAPGRVRHAGIKGLHGRTLHLSIGVGPDRGDLLRSAEWSGQNRRRPSGRESAGDFAEPRRKSVRHAVDQKIPQHFAPDFLGFGIKQPRFAQPSHCGMDFRGAHAEFISQVCITGSRGDGQRGKRSAGDLVGVGAERW